MLKPCSMRLVPRLPSLPAGLRFLLAIAPPERGRFRCRLEDDRELGDTLALKLKRKKQAVHEAFSFCAFHSAREKPRCGRGCLVRGAY